MAAAIVPLVILLRNPLVGERQLYERTNLDLGQLLQARQPDVEINAAGSDIVEWCFVPGGASRRRAIDPEPAGLGDHGQHAHL